MTEAAILLTGIIVGYLLCYFAYRAPQGRRKDEEVVMVKRSKPSLRSPLKTHRSEYEKYRTRDTGLYAPTKAKDKKDEITVAE